MRTLKTKVHIDTIKKLSPGEVGEFCERALSAGTLLEELQEEYEPFGFGGRKDLCKYLGVAESTLAGWLKEERVPRMAQEAYVLLVVLGVLQAHVRRLEDEATHLKIVRDGEAYLLVRFVENDEGTFVGEVTARDIPDLKSARVLASSDRALKLLDEAYEEIAAKLEFGTSNGAYREFLEDLNHRMFVERFDALTPHAKLTLSKSEIADMLANDGAKESADGEGSAPNDGRESEGAS